MHEAHALMIIIRSQRIEVDKGMNSSAALQHAPCPCGMCALMHRRVLTAKMMVEIVLAETTTAILLPTFKFDTSKV